MHVYIMESFRHIPETNTTLQINYTLKKKKKKKTHYFHLTCLYIKKKEKEKRKKLECNSVSMNFKHGDDSGCSLRSL